MNLEESAVVRDASPASASFSAAQLSIPRGIGIHFDPSAPGSSAVAEPPAPPAAPAAPASPAVPASPADGRPAAPPAASHEDVGLRQLREQYEATKKNLEPWEKLGAKPDDVARQLPIVQKMHSEAQTLGQKLGYEAADIEEHFANDPVKVLAFLRQQAQQIDSRPLSAQDLRTEMQRLVEERLKPVTAREDARLNKEAEFRFDTEFEKLFKENFKDPLPDKAKQALYEMVGQLIGEDADAIKRLKFEGQTSDIAKHFTAAKTRLLDIFAEWSQAERKRLGQEPPAAPGTPPKPESRLDKKMNFDGKTTVRDLFNV